MKQVSSPKKWLKALGAFFANVLKILKTDLQSIWYNFTARSAIIALCIIPSLYAWFYLKSAWDPYGNTQWIKIAVASNDQGTLMSGEYINLWQETIENLRNNTQIWWVFVDDTVARQGVERWAYSSAIIIETGFSEHIASFTSKEPIHPKVEYIINQKTNSIAAKISFQGMNNVVGNIQKNFISTLNQTIFEHMNSAGKTIKEQESMLNESVNLINQSNSTIQQMDSNMGNLIEQVNVLESLVTHGQTNLPLVDQSLWTNQEILDLIADFSDTQSDFLVDQLHGIQNQIPQITSLLNHTSDATEHLADGASNTFNTAVPVLQDLSADLSGTYNKLTTVISWATYINNVFYQYFQTKPLQPTINKLIKIQSNVLRTKGLISTSLSNVKYDLNALQTISNDINAINDDLIPSLHSLDNNISSTLLPFIDDISPLLSDTHTTTNALLQSLKDQIPTVNTGLSLWLEALDTIQHNLTILQTNLPKFKNSINTITREINKIHNGDSLEKLTDLLAADPESHSNFVTDMIDIEQTDLFNIPNYGSGMAPFFTALALWTGSLLLTTMFSTNLSYRNRYTFREQFVGKMLFFFIIVIIQATILALGNIFILKAYVAEPALFIFSTICISITRSAITFTLVKVFGNIGKVLCVLLLVLQLTGAGWSFPVELSPTFFQVIHPFLPFTYAIGMLRESVWGVVRDMYWADWYVLFWFVVGSLILWLAIWPHTQAMVERMNDKLNETGLTPHSSLD